MGLVIAAGMTIGTLFTLFVVPAMYLYLGRDYAASGHGVPSPRPHPSSHPHPLPDAQDPVH